MGGYPAINLDFLKRESGQSPHMSQAGFPVRNCFDGIGVCIYMYIRAHGNVVWYVDGVRGRLMRFDMDQLHGTQVLERERGREGWREKMRTHIIHAHAHPNTRAHAHTGRRPFFQTMILFFSSNLALRTQVIDHRKANVRRYLDVHLTRRPGVPGHMVVDPEHEHLYISDPGAGRILRVKTSSGRFYRGAMCLERQCYRHENHYWTCGQQRHVQRERFPSKASCQASAACVNAVENCVRDIDNLCDPADGGWCRYGECAMSDGFGCYTAFTEMGSLFEYELWGCTEYEVFAEQLGLPSGIALSPAGRVLVADYDSGDIWAFDKQGGVLGRVSSGSSGVTGLELQCAADKDGSDTGDADSQCRLWLTNSEDKTVSYLSLQAACPESAVSASALPLAPVALNQTCVADCEVCTKDREKTCSSSLTLTDRMRPDLGWMMSESSDWQERMVIHYSYGKDCTELPEAQSVFAACSTEGMNSRTVVS